VEEFYAMGYYESGRGLPQSGTLRAVRAIQTYLFLSRYRMGK
jgi:hypothetical protein